MRNSSIRALPTPEGSERTCRNCELPGPPHADLKNLKAVPPPSSFSGPFSLAALAAFGTLVLGGSVPLPHPAWPSGTPEPKFDPAGTPLSCRRWRTSSAIGTGLQRAKISASLLANGSCVVQGVESHGILWFGFGRDSFHRLGCAAWQDIGEMLKSIPASLQGLDILALVPDRECDCRKKK